jgi:mono/diheme cytochrome c family protein
MKTDRSSSTGVRRTVLSVALAVVFVGASHALLVSCGGGSSQQSASNEPAPSTQPAPAPAPESSATAAASSAGDVAAGEKIYKMRCTPCHGLEGKGDGPLGKSLNPRPRNHTDAAYMKSRTDAELLEVIMNGKGAMPGWVKTKVLTEQEARNALAYVRTLAK